MKKKGLSEATLHAYNQRWLAGTLGVQQMPWFRGIITSVSGNAGRRVCRVARTLEASADGRDYYCFSEYYDPQVGDDVECIMREDNVGFVLWAISGKGLVANLHAEVWGAGAWTLNDSTTTVLPFDTEEGDPGNNFSTTTHAFTCPIPGRYRVEGFFILNMGGVAVNLQLGAFVNGSERKQLCHIEHASTHSNPGAGGSATLRCIAGDVIDLRGTQISGAIRNGWNAQNLLWGTFAWAGPS